jgi:adenosine/AMP kinase
MLPRDEAINRVQELEEKLKVQEEKHKVALAAAEAKTQELRSQTSEREELLAARLRGMVEDLTGKGQLLGMLIERPN